MASKVSYARYGKDNIRLYKVMRDDKTGVQDVCEMTVCVLLEGDIESSYTRADNSVVVPTDTMKNTTYIVAKQNPVLPLELFASTLGTHFVDTYAHIHVAHVKIVGHKWTRYAVDGKPHPHSFVRDGADTRNVEAVVREGDGITLRSSIADLLVLKSTGSAFYDFHKDEYTTLKDTHDRILSTSVDAHWQWKKFNNLDAVKAAVPKFDPAYEKAREVTLRTFAVEESPSVQNTMYIMADQILAAVPDVVSVDYTLPNKHYFEIDLSWHNGLKNTGKDAEVYAPQSNPNGLIHCVVVRDEKKQ